MTTDGIGLYLHFPFCVRKCNYCDFCSVPHCKDMAERYTARLIKEIRSYKRDERIKLSTLFFGGGTPSLMTVEQMEAVMTAVRESFCISTDAEASIEINPGTCTKEKLLAYKRMGINRISFGLQSVHQNEMKRLGRIHSLEEFTSAYTDARSVGFDNISVDLMYGIPEQTIQSFTATLDLVISLSPEHISVYGLIVEEGTPFFEDRERLDLPDEDTECDMYESACRMLGDTGYHHYEISNYAKPGFECRHNLKYWRDLEYIGVGASAYSYFEGFRFGNTRSIEEYISSDEPKYIYNERIDFESSAFEYSMMRLRLAEGLNLSEYEKTFGRPFIGENREAIERFTDMGLMSLTDGVLSFTERGFYLSNSVLSSIL